METTEEQLIAFQKQFKNQFLAINKLSQRLRGLGDIVQNCPPTVDDISDFVSHIGKLNTVPLKLQTKQLNQCINNWTKTTELIVNDFNKLMKNVVTKQKLRSE